MCLSYEINKQRHRSGTSSTMPASLPLSSSLCPSRFTLYSQSQCALLRASTLSLPLFLFYPSILYLYTVSFSLSLSVCLSLSLAFSLLSYSFPLYLFLSLSNISATSTLLGPNKAQLHRALSFIRDRPGSLWTHNKH